MKEQKEEKEEEYSNLCLEKPRRREGERCFDMQDIKQE